MNAADVLQAAMYPYGATPMASYSARTLTGALLAHGEQGVAILPDGTLMELRKLAAPPGVHVYSLERPMSAVAGD
jgi:hypothetical protein